MKSFHSQSSFRTVSNGSFYFFGTGVWVTLLCCSAMIKNAINTKFIIDVDQGPYYIDTLSTILLHSLLILLYTFEKFSTLFLNDCNLTVLYRTILYCILLHHHAEAKIYTVWSSLLYQKHSYDRDQWFKDWYRDSTVQRTWVYYNMELYTSQVHSNISIEIAS